MCGQLTSVVWEARPAAHCSCCPSHRPTHHFPSLRPAGGPAVEGQQGDAVPDGHAARKPALQAAPAACPYQPWRRAACLAGQLQQRTSRLPARYSSRSSDPGSACPAGGGGTAGDAGSGWGPSSTGGTCHSCCAAKCRWPRPAVACGVCRLPAHASRAAWSRGQPAAGGISRWRQEQRCSHAQVRGLFLVVARGKSFVEWPSRVPHELRATLTRAS